MPIPIEVYSFFSGVGFLDLGFENAGFDIVFVNEHNERFLQAYKYARRNRNYMPRYGYSHADVREYLLDDKWEKAFPEYNNREDKLIGFIGGPPCPDFSVAGKNQGKDGINGQLTSVYFQLIEKKKPDFFIFENVKGLYKTKKHRDFYESEKLKLKEAGYILFDSIENALAYGTPQYRDRLFLIGFLDKSFGDDVVCQLGSHKLYDLEIILNMDWPATAPFNVGGYVQCPINIQKELTVEYWFEKNQVNCHPNGKDIFKIKSIEKYTKIDEGNTGGKSFKRLHRWRYAPTAAYGNNEVHLHPYELRRLSVAEAMAVQSAPRDFELPENIPLSLKFKMVGNAVPVLLAYGIAQDVMQTINSRGDMNNG